jgi:hypothetical protein
VQARCSFFGIKASKIRVSESIASAGHQLKIIKREKVNNSVMLQNQNFGLLLA